MNFSQKFSGRLVVGNYFDTFQFPKETHYIDALNDAPSLPWSWLDETELQVFIDSYRGQVLQVG